MGDLLDKIIEAKEIKGDDAAVEIAKHLNILNYDESKMKGSCPFGHSDSTPSFIWNKKDKCFTCFSCGKRYSILDMYTETEGSYFSGIKRLFKETNIAYNFKGQKLSKEEYFLNYKYPKIETNTELENVIRYLEKRGISEKTIRYAGIKQDIHGNIVFESHDLDGTLLSSKYRKAGKVLKGQPKMWYQKDASNCPILYNIDKVDITKPLVITEGECYTGDTEILTPEGWIRLDQYDGQQVMQVHEDMTGDFITPLAYVKHEYDGDMYYRDNRTSKLAVTANHNMVYVDYNGKVTKRKASEMPKNIGRKYIPTVINYDGPGIPLTDEQIALYIAVCADCTIDIRQSTGHRHSRFGVKKDRKYTRMKSILDRLGIEYFDNPNAKDGYKYIGFVTPNWIKNKYLPQEWLYLATNRQKQFILNELIEWDGNNVINRNQVEFSSKFIENAELVQSLAVTLGYGSSILKRHNNHGVWYRVNIRYNNNHVIFQDGWDKIEHYNGMVYCVTVPTGMILVRYKGKTLVCGNCDTLSIIEAGWNNVASIPRGSADTGWIEFNYEFLENFETIILWFDNDSAGQNGLNNTIKRIGEYRCKIIRPETTDEDNIEKYYQEFNPDVHIRKTDANNILLACGKDRIIQLINTAEDIPIKNISYLMDAKSIPIDELEKFPTGISGIDDIIYGNIFPCFSIYSGQAGAGKSSLANIATIISAIEHDEKVFIYSGELASFQLSDWLLSPLAGYNHIIELRNEEYSRSFFRVTDQAENKIREFYRKNILLYNGVDNLETSSVDIINTMEVAYRKFGCRVFLIDNLMSVSLEGITSDSKWEAQKKFIIQLANFTNKYDVNVNLVAHPRKPGGGQATTEANVYNISGASEIANLCHRMFWVSRIKDETLPQDIGKLKIEIVKDRPTQSGGQSCEAYYDKKTRRIYTNEEEKNKIYKWESQLKNPINYPNFVKEKLIKNKKHEMLEECDQF